MEGFEVEAVFGYQRRGGVGMCLVKVMYVSIFLAFLAY